MLGAALLVLASACTFEPRPERVGAEEEGAAGAETPGVPMLVEDSLRELRTTFQEAMESGDLSSALALLDRDAVLVDRLVDLEPPTASRGEILLEVLRRHGEGLRLEPVRSELMVVGGSSLLVTRYDVWEEVEGEPRVTGSMLETLVAMRSPDGWRIQHLHRSFGGHDALDR